MNPIIYSRGSILDSPADLIVIPVNCVGVMGAGLARQFASKHPDLEAAYKEACGFGLLHPGQVYIGKKPFAYATTKQHWRHPTKPDWIHSTLYELLAVGLLDGYRTLALPALGCGCGGVDWILFKDLAEDVLLPIYGTAAPGTVTIYEPR